MFKIFFNNIQIGIYETKSLFNISRNGCLDYADPVSMHLTAADGGITAHIHQKK